MGWVEKKSFMLFLSDTGQAFTHHGQSANNKWWVIKIMFTNNTSPLMRPEGHGLFMHLGGKEKR